MGLRAWFVAGLLMAMGAQHAIGDELLPPVQDLRPLAHDVARRQIPLLILFSTAGCPYCLEVRRSYLQPRLTEAVNEILIREVDIGSSRSMQMLDGSTTTEAAFAARFDIRVVPVVLLLDAKMMPLTEPLVGLDRSGFYESRLQSTIDAARQQLRARQ